jgi:prophage regulatory protein
MSNKKRLALLRRPAVQDKTGLRETQIDELEKKGNFPKRVQISSRAVGWVEDEVDEWIHARIRARDTQPSPGQPEPLRRQRLLKNQNTAAR